MNVSYVAKISSYWTKPMEKIPSHQIFIAEFPDLGVKTYGKDLAHLETRAQALVKEYFHACKLLELYKTHVPIPPANFKNGTTKLRKGRHLRITQNLDEIVVK